MSDVVDVIMDNFDFGRVRGMMVGVNWEWYMAAGDRRVPEESEMRTCARNLLRRAVKESKASGTWWSTSTGGFHAEADCSDGEVWAKLYFGIDWACSGGDE